jgi:hypothetical protein
LLSWKKNVWLNLRHLAEHLFLIFLEARVPCWHASINVNERKASASGNGSASGGQLGDVRTKQIGAQA